MNRIKIPQTDSIEELARFWDTHDLTDFADELEEVKESVFEHQTEVTIRLEPQVEPQDASAVTELAKSRGISQANLIQEWIVERIQTSAGSIV